MSVFEHLAPSIPQVSTRQTEEHPPAGLTLPLSLSSPVIKKRAIKIPSFDEKGLIYKKHDIKQTIADRSFIAGCSSNTSSQSCRSKSCQYSQMNYGERASTLPRTKPKTHSSPTLSAKPSIPSFPAPKPNSSPTPSPLTRKPSDSAPDSQLTALSPLLHQPKPSVSPTLTIPTLRLSPSPTSMCQGVSSDGQGSKQPSPVAKERRARSITISNNKSLSNETRHDILDQDVLLDFTHTALRRSYSMRSKESQSHTYFESLRQAATSENPCLLQSKEDNILKDKQRSPSRNLDFTAIPKPKSNIKQQLELLPSGVTGKQKTISEGFKFGNVHREAQSMTDGLATQSSLKLQRKCTDYPQNRHYAQTASFASSHQSYEHMNSAALPLTPKISFSTQPLLTQSTVSPSIETRRRQFDSYIEKKVDVAVLPSSGLRRPQEENDLQRVTRHSELSESQNIQSRLQHRHWLKAQGQTAQMDVQSTVNQCESASEDYSCKSRHIDHKVDASQCAHRLNQLKTCLVVPQTQEASRPASVEGTSQTGSAPKPDMGSQRHLLNHKTSPGQNKNHKDAKLSDTGLNQRDIFSTPDHHVMSTKLHEHPSEKIWPLSVPHCPNSSGIPSKGVLPSQPQHRVNQRPEETTTMVSFEPHDFPADRAFIMEEPEDPYYVTMYYPGSVYVGEY